MSVRVNLLPEVTRARSRAVRQRGMAALAGVGLLVVLGGVYWWAGSQVSDAEEQLEVERARTSELRSEEAELVAFRELADRRDRAGARLTTALGDEVSAAGILQDVAAVIPADTQLETLTVTLDEEGDDEAEEVEAPTTGTFSVTGKTLTSHAPGVERVLISLDKVVSFRELYLNSSALDENDDRIATFSLDGRLDRSLLTGRYADGLPPELR